MIYSILIPRWHPPRVNQLYAGHWAARAKLKRECHQIVAAYARAAGVPVAAGKRRVGLTIHLSIGQRGGDVDAYWKAVLDSLTSCKLLRDDSRTWCEIEPVAYVRDGMATTITLTDL